MKKYIFLSSGFTVLFLTISILATINGCRSENAEEYFEQNNSTNECDPVFVSYQTHIDPLFKRSCVDCHSGQAVLGCDLDNYDNTMAYIQNNQPQSKLFDYVKDNTQQGVVLDSCDYNKFSKWILNPAP